jgi:hypothetical protein
VLLCVRGNSDYGRLLRVVQCARKRSDARRKVGEMLCACVCVRTLVHGE